MLSLPAAAEPFLAALTGPLSQPVAQRLLLLAVGATLTTGRRTVTRILTTAGGLVQGHFSSYHRVFSRASWSTWAVGKVLARLALDLLPPDEPVLVAGDDTVAQHRGKHVYGKGRHRDAVRSSHAHTVWKWGHKWVTLAILVPVPFVRRRWALPVLAVLYRPEELDRAEGRRHRTPPALVRQLLAVLVHWFPDRKFILVADGSYATHELARFCHRHRRHVTFVSRFYAAANLYDPPPAYRGRGRPRVKGTQRPTPQEVVAARKRLRKALVSWYGGQRRRIGSVSDRGQWYKAGCGLVPVRWVFVRDQQGTHRDEYFFTTDPAMAPEQIVSRYTERWSIETTYQELRAHLGFETTRQRVAASVLRTGPCLLGLFSVISLIYAAHLRDHRPELQSLSWYAKEEPTFADALTAVRRLFWEETIFASSAERAGLAKLPADLKETLLNCLCPAA
jgi:DDE superfamily endonuclease/Archaeal putative transposase ISC1217